MTIELVELLLPPSVNLILLAMLVFYRLKRRFKQERSGLLAFLEHNIVEIIFGIVVAPDLVGLLTKLVK